MPTEITIWDNGGATLDRYTVAFRLDEKHGGTYYMGIGDTGNAPNGFCMHVGGPEAVHEGDHLGTIIDLQQMTEAAQRAIQQELHNIQRELTHL